MRRLLAIGVTLLIASAALGPASAAGTGGLFDLQGEFDRVQFHIVVAEDGTGEWSFRYERRLENASQRQQFETFAERFRTNETTMYRDFRDQATALVDHGSRATGRNMTATGFERNATVVMRLNTLGVVEMGFSWRGFAATEDNRVLVGDVFQGGLYLGSSQSLVIEAGNGLRFRSVDPNGTTPGPTLAESDTVTWQGEYTFPDEHPQAVFERVERAAGAAETPTTERSTPTGETEADASPSTRRAGTMTAGTTDTRWVAPALGGIAVLVGVGLTILWYRSGTGGTVAGTEDDGIEAEPEAVMDDQERVAALLREHGGRMRQSAIVEETGWSKSKVSMVLSEMEDTSQVTKLRVGRENLISLPGEEPDAAGSPYEED